jgi:hypothetical protein
MMRQRGRSLAKLLLLAAVLSAPPAAAAELSLSESLPQLQLHGFISQGFLLTTANDYLAHSSRGSFEFSEAGLNFTMPVSDRFTLGLQLFARKLGLIGDYKATFDWYYLDYHFRDWLGIRAGRVKLPFGLYNDSSDIDSARTAVLLPQSIYPAQNRDFLLAQTGVEVYGYHRLGSPGALDYRFYAGTIFVDVKPQPGSPLVVRDLDVPFVVGGRVMWEPPIDGLRLGGSIQVLRFDLNLLVPSVASPVLYKLPATLLVASAEYVVREFLFAVEYSRWLVKAESSRPDIVPNDSPTSERAYALATYRVYSWLQTGAYYSLFFPNADRRSGRENMQHDLALTFRFDVNPFWLVKIEGHYLRGTAALDPMLNDNQLLSALRPGWALFTVKTTAFF